MFCCNSKIKNQKIKLTKKYQRLVDSNDIFSFINFKEYDLLEGWKIHIAAKYDNYNSILRIVSKFCIDNKVNFKFINNTKLFIELLTNDQLNNLTGKFITIYPESEFETKKIIINLYLLLKNFKGPRTHSNRHYKNSIISYRYFQTNEKNFITRKYKPDNIKDIFPIPKKDNHPFKNFEVLGLIVLKPFGSIFLIKDLNNKYYVVKESKKYMGQNGNGSIKSRNNELQIINSLMSKKINNFFPDFVKRINYDQSVLFFYKFIKGKTLTFLKNELSFLNFNNFLSKLTKALNINNLMRDILLFCENNKLMLNDINLNNFIISEDNKLYFIDLEYSNFKNEQSFLIHSEYHYDIHANSFEADKQKISLMLLDLYFDVKSLLFFKKILKRLFHFYHTFCLI
ncbi:hypothetical protein MCAV_05850 [[Mycoplasma] cavipharyngis]|uniref:class III lanthionine synthetase LanKC N-terminal domain-containing protein n=1 Tax=[Mycoplasma] cavipharyngis TaxID=92757 RepID=UPI003703E23B